MEITTPADFLPMSQWLVLYGKPVFSSVKLMSYHLQPIQKELIEAGGMAKVGNRIYLHKARFWPEYQRIQAALLDAGKQGA